jgi:hypothetical protein
MSDKEIKAQAALYDLDIMEISMTDASQGGPASDMKTILCKGKTKEDLTPEQLEMIESYGEEFTPLYKQRGNDKDSPSSVEGDTGEETNVTKGNDEPMSEINQETIDAKDAEIELLKSALAEREEADLKSSLGKYDFADLDSVVKVLKGLEKDDKDVLIKSFDGLLEGKEQLQKSLNKQEEIEKDFGEVGEDGTAEETPELTLNETIAKKLQEKIKGA